MRRRSLIATLAAGSILSPGLRAQGTAPLRLIVPYAPGGGGDSVARLVAKPLGEHLGRPVVVENRPGANGVVAVQALLGAEPDGNTFLLTDSSILSINPLIYKGLKYDPKKDFEPVALLARSPLFLAVHPKVTAQTFDELIALARAQPGRLNYGTPGAGSTHHLCMEFLKSSLKIDMQHVPFKGASQAMAAVVAGEVDMTLAALPSLQSFAQSNRVRILAVNSLTRYPKMPDLPAIAEAIPGFEFASTVGVVASRGVPRAALQVAASAFARAAKAASVTESFASMGIESIGAESAEYGRLIRMEDERIAKAVRAANLRLD